MISTVSPRRLEELHRRDPRLELIDVRTPIEYREIHVDFARNVPLDRLDPAALRNICAGKPLYVICKSGKRSAPACERLAAEGVDVVSVEGGIEQWGASGLPVVRGQKMISLERQVRITAGALTLGGVTLGYFVHPIGLGLAAFIGAGLMFSGITDTCGMGMLLARMPWNKVKVCCDKSTASHSESASDSKPADP